MEGLDHHIQDPDTDSARNLAAVEGNWILDLDVALDLAVDRARHR